MIGLDNDLLLTRSHHGWVNITTCGAHLLHDTTGRLVVGVIVNGGRVVHVMVVMMVHMSHYMVMMYNCRVLKYLNRRRRWQVARPRRQNSRSSVGFRRSLTTGPWIRGGSCPLGHINVYTMYLSILICSCICIFKFFSGALISGWDNDITHDFIIGEILLMAV